MKRLDERSTTTQADSPALGLMPEHLDKSDNSKSFTERHRLLALDCNHFGAAKYYALFISDETPRLGITFY